MIQEAVGDCPNGQGYKLRTWTKKSGYSADELRQFVEDLFVLCDELGLRVAGIGKGLGSWRSLSNISVLVATGAVRALRGVSPHTIRRS
jgi:hypothetical protein